MTGGGTEGNVLLRRVSRAMFWNASMLPAIMAVNLAAAVLIRRGFGLESGAYDVALGVVNTLLAHSGLGVPLTLAQFVPGLEASRGREAVLRFVRAVAGVRFLLLLAAIGVLNLFAVQIATYLHMGASGVWLLRVISVLALLRAASDLAVRVLQAVLAHASSNLIQLAQAVALVGAVTWVLGSRGSMASLFVLLTFAAVGISAGAIIVAVRHLRQLPAQPTAQVQTAHELKSAPAVAASPASAGFWRFALFMYVFEVAHYFETPSFASPALAAATGGTETVALFNVAFQFPMMVVIVMLSGLQGVYRPLFARVMAENAPERIRTSFAEVTKVQIALLIPAGVGLGLLLPDYIPLLFTDRFSGAVILAQILCAFIFLETLFNLGNILLSVDHRYGVVLTGQALKTLAAPLFVWLAVRGHLVLATAVFGMGRLVGSLIGHFAAQRLYGIRFPLAFTARVCMATLLMAVAVGAGRVLLPSSWVTTVFLTIVGAVLTLLGARWFAVLGRREIDLLDRAGLPGGTVLLQWLTAGRTLP